MRITKAMILSTISDIVSSLTDQEIAEISDAVTREDILNYCAHTRDQIEAKALKEQERKELRKAGSAELVETIYAVLTDTPKTRGEILKAIPENSDLTEAKIGGIQTFGFLIMFGI